MPEAKYFDLYATSTGIKGDATNADGTNSWYGDYTGFVNASNPWFVRGGNYLYGVAAGVFNFGNVNGDSSSNFSAFRPVLSRP